LRDQDAPAERYELLRAGRPAEVAFWWRSSPQPLLPEASDLGPGSLWYDAPAFDVRGMIRLRLDTRGRLLFFEALPRAQESLPAAASADWSVLFDAAELDMTAFQPVAPSMVSPFAPLEETADAADEPLIVMIIAGFLIALLLAVVLGALLLAQRNVRLGRGDRRGAQRLAAVLMVCMMLGWVFTGDHATGFNELFLLIQNFVWALVFAALGWSFYLAAEPLLRRRGPHMLIGWTRLLESRLGDPLVARDVLVGCAVAALSAALVAPVNAFFAFGFFLIYTVLLLIFRNRYVGPAVWIAVMIIPPALLNENYALTSVPFIVFGWVLWFVVMLRFGVLAFTVTVFVEESLISHVIALDLSPWYARDTMVALIIFLTLVGLAFWRAVEWKGSFADVLDQA
jgi:hypothetical protein